MNSGSAATVHVDRLSKRYGPFWALRDASFAIRPGEILGLIGPNGSGKTTLFRCVAGLSPATSGDVRVGDASIAPSHRKRHLYFVPDGVRPWNEQSVRWALEFSAGLQSASPDALARVSSAFSLDALAGARVGELSKGEHRRVMLAVGLLTAQPLLMFDEP